MKYCTKLEINVWYHKQDQKAKVQVEGGCIPDDKGLKSLIENSY